MFHSLILGLLLSSPAIALTGGDPHRDPSIVTLFRGDIPVGMGVWVGPRHILTVSSVCPPQHARELRIQRKMRWEGHPTVLEEVVSAQVFGPLHHPESDNPLESPMLLVSERAAPNSASLLNPGESPGARTGNRDHLSTTGLGQDGTRSWVAAGSAALGSWVPSQTDAHPFQFHVSESEQTLNAWDRGAPLWDDRVVVGVLGQRQNDKSTFYWTGHPLLLAWVGATISNGPEAAVPEPVPDLDRRKPTRVRLPEPAVPDSGDSSIRILP